MLLGDILQVEVNSIFVPVTLFILSFRRSIGCSFGNLQSPFRRWLLSISIYLLGQCLFDKYKLTCEIVVLHTEEVCSKMTSTCDKGIQSCNHQNHCQAKKPQKLQLMEEKLHSILIFHSLMHSFLIWMSHISTAFLWQ